MDQETKDALLNFYNYAKTEALLGKLTESFDGHVKDDKEITDKLFTALRNIPAQLQKEIEADMEDKYITREEFKVFQANTTNSIENACEKINQASVKIDSVNKSIRSWIIWTATVFAAGVGALATILAYLKP